MVHPSRKCLPAASLECEISRSQGTQGPIPGYEMQGPSCNSLVALAITEQSEEQHTSTSANIVALAHSMPGAVHTTLQDVELEPTVNHNIVEGTTSGPDVHMEDVHDEFQTEGFGWEAENRVIRQKSSLNIAGRDANVSMNNTNHKFKFLKETIDINNLGALGIQEGHFDTNAAVQFNNVFNRWFKLYYSADPDKPCSTAGVAFVLNKKFVDTDNIREHVLIPGWALMIAVPWKGESLNILNIYAPNRPEERDEMWKTLWLCWANNPELPFPHVVLGDWNFVEDPADRNSGAAEFIPESFTRFKHLLRPQDGWRSTFPDAREYTCSQFRRSADSEDLHSSYSRIDRIYVALATQLQKDVELQQYSDRDPANNIQTLWEKFKSDVTIYGKHCFRFIKTDSTRQIRSWRAQLKIAIHDEEMTREE
ncbi:hypothetical protein B0H17DRAFT_1131100 [Mycena rosella]|uniref:Endonuclease/exonuclease/phosphatase domain-containing protein n=1 Tax=Mycena rosella TaxID=1033263 RepID=A0AAD7DP01_MYCRO|nr:hypothetical protein B0H17DRAFT_1131100 [Mycena rosella]